jgi:hypothetical protein
MLAARVVESHCHLIRAAGLTAASSVTPNGRAKRRAAEMLAKNDPASRRVRLSARLDPAL